MPYAILEVELVGRYSQLEQSLERMDSSMRKVARKDYSIGFKLDPWIFKQIENVKRFLRTIGTVTANVDIKVNGQALQVERDVGRVSKVVDTIGTAADKTNEKIELLNRRLQSLGGGASTRLGLDPKALAGFEAPFDVLQARALKFQQEYGKYVSPNSIIKSVRGVAGDYEKQGIDADAIKAAIPQLRQLLSLQQEIKANRIVKIDVGVDAEGKAFLRDLSLELKGTQLSAKELEAAMRRVDNIKRDLRRAGVGAQSILGRDPKLDAESLNSYAAAARRAISEKEKLTNETEKAATAAQKERMQLLALLQTAREISTQTGASLPALSGVRSDKIQALSQWIAQTSAQVKELQAVSSTLSGKGFEAFVQSVLKGSGTVEQRLDRLKAKLLELGDGKVAGSSWSPSKGAFNSAVLDEKQVAQAEAEALRLAAAAKRIAEIKRELREAGIAPASVIGRTPALNTEAMAQYEAAARRAVVASRELAREQEKSANTAAKQRAALAELRVTLKDLAGQTGASLPSLSGLRADGLRSLIAQLREIQDITNRLNAKGYTAFTKGVSESSLTTEQRVEKLRQKLAELGSVKPPSSAWSQELGAYKKELEAAAKASADAGKESKSFASAVGMVLNTISRWALGYFVVSQLINAIQALRFAFIDFNALVETSRIALTTMLNGSAQQADLLLGKLREFAKLTPFEFKDLVPLTQRLIVLGVVAKDKIQDLAIPALTAIGNSVSALGGGAFEIERVVRALGQMSTKGKISAEEVSRQLGEIGIDAPKYLAKAANKTVPEIFELMKKGALDGKKGVQAILYGMANDPLYKDMMEKQSKTFTGAFANIKDSLTELLSGGFLNVFIAISQGLQRLQAILNTQAFKDFAGAVTDYVLAPLRLIGGVLLWLVGEFMDKLPYIAAALAVIFGARFINMISLAILWVRAYGVQSIAAAAKAAAAWVAANAPLVITIALIAALIAAYRKFPEVQKVVEDAILNGILLVKYWVHGWAWAFGQISAGFRNLADIIAPDEILDRLGSVGEAVKGWKHGILDTFNMENVEVDTDKMFDEWIDSWIRTGSKRFNSFMTGDFIGSLGLRDIMSRINSEIANGAKLDPGLDKLKMPADLWLDGTGGKDALNRQKKALQEAAKQYDMLAKAAEQAGKRQLDALKQVRDILRDIFGSIQDELARYGVLTSPLDAVIERIEKLANLGPRMVGVVGASMERANNFRLNAQEARNQLAALNSQAAAKSGGTAAAASNNKVSAADVASMISSNSAGINSAFGGKDSGAAVMPASTALAQTAVASGKAVSNVMLKSIIQEFNDKSDRSLGASCADVAAHVMNRIGQGLKYSARADVLEQNAIKAGWKPVPLGTPGSLTFQGQHGNRYFGKVSGMHALVGIGNGQVMGSSNYKTSVQNVSSLYGHNAQPRAYLPTGGGNLPAFMKNAGGQGAAAELSAQSGGTSVVEEMLGLLQDLKLSKLSPLPKEWGAAVKEGADTTARFKVQMLLANTATQSLLRAALGEKGFADMVKQLRAATNEADEMLGRLRAGKAISDEIRALDAKARSRGREGDPFAALSERRRPGGDLFYAEQDKFDALTTKTLRDALDSHTYSVRQNTEAVKNRRKALDAGAKFVQAGVVDEYNYTRAIELRGKEVEYWTSQEVKALARRATELERIAKANGLKPGEQGPVNPYGVTAGRQAREIRTTLNRDAATAARVAREAYDYEKAVARKVDMEKARQEGERRTTQLNAQIPLVSQLAGKEAQLNDALESQAYYFGELYRLRDLGHSDPRSIQLARELTQRHNLNRELERSLALTREIDAAKFSLAQSRQNTQALSDIYSSSVYGSEEQTRNLRYEDALKPLRERQAKGEFDYAFGSDKYLELVNSAKAAVDEEIKREKTANRAETIYSSQNDLLNQQLTLREKGLELEGLLNDAGRYENQLNAEIIRRRGTMSELQGEELQNRLKVLAVIKQIESAEFARQVRATKDEIASYSIPGNDNDRANWLSQQNLNHMEEALQKLLDKQRDLPIVSDGWKELQGNIDAARIAIERAQEQFSLDKVKVKSKEAADATRQAVEAAQNAVVGGFEAMATTSGTVFDRLLGGVEKLTDGIANYLLQMAQKILANYIVMQVLGALLPGFGNFLGQMQQYSNGLPTMPGGKSGNAPTKGDNGGGDTASAPAPGGAASATMADQSSAKYAASASRSTQNVTVENHFHNDFSGIRDASEASGAANVISRQVGGSWDSQRTIQKQASDLVTRGTEGR